MNEVWTIISDYVIRGLPNSAARIWKCQTSLRATGHLSTQLQCHLEYRQYHRNTLCFHILHRFIIWVFAVYIKVCPKYSLGIYSQNVESLLLSKVIQQSSTNFCVCIKEPLILILIPFLSTPQSLSIFIKLPDQHKSDTAEVTVLAVTGLWVHSQAKALWLQQRNGTKWQAQQTSAAWTMRPY